jgi:excisionase family DNA binding protein
MEQLAVDVCEAARVLSVSVHTIRRHIQKGGITATRIGRRVVIAVAELERLADQGLGEPANSRSETCTRTLRKQQS